MRDFSKSKLMASLQCHRRFWLETHRPELREDSADTQMNFQFGHQVGAIAQRIYDPQNLGALIDVANEGFVRAFERTTELLRTPQPIFEAGFRAGGAHAFADVMLPVQVEGQLVWSMVEVKSSTKVKDNHRDDAAVQAFVARNSGTPLQSIALAHIDKSWVYPGNGDYRGLLIENDLTEEAFSRGDEVKAWIAQAQSIYAIPSEPLIEPGGQCHEPYACGFMDHCRPDESEREYPLHWLPNLRSAKREYFAELGIHDLTQVPDDLISERQQWVKEQTLANTVYFDADGAAQELARYGLPAYFLDFESAMFAVPIWQGTRPYQHCVFQFSLHTLLPSGELHHTGFLDLSGSDPSEPLAQALVAACGDSGPVYAYNAGFEKGQIRQLAQRHPHLSAALLGINERVVDLMSIARNHYYHPSQHGSWSLKVVLPAVVPELSYDDLDGVADGGMAMAAFHEAIHPDTSDERKSKIEQQLLTYCKLDIYALVRLWQVFAGLTDLKI
jgi:hypothetical protein